MPRKIRQLIADLQRAGFRNRGGKGSHRNFQHPDGRKVTLSGKPNKDARLYQESLVNKALKKQRKPVKK